MKLFERLTAYNENGLKKIFSRFSKKILALSVLLCDIPILRKI